MSNILAAKAKERREKEALVEKKAKDKALLLKTLEDKRLAREKQIRDDSLDAEADRERIARDALEKIKEHNTKEYFEYNAYGRKVQPREQPMYFGEHRGQEGAWMPHGYGEFYLNGGVKIEGKYRDGNLHGNAKYHFLDNTMWDGEFKNGRMHGVGYVIEDPKEPLVRREAMARNNCVLCYKDELRDGKQIEFADPAIRLVSHYYGKPRANIIRHCENWRYLIRFHDELVPRERELDFSSVKAFTILHHLPCIYELSGYGVKVDAPKTYDYYADTYGAAAGRPRLGIAVSRRTEEMGFRFRRPLSPREREASAYGENVFETAFLGVGSAKAEEEAILKREMKKQQWGELIEKRREEEEAQRQKSIEEEQQKYLQEQLELQREKALRKKADDEQFQRRLKDSLDEEAARWDGGGEAARGGQ